MTPDNNSGFSRRIGFPPPATTALTSLGTATVNAADKAAAPNLQSIPIGRSPTDGSSNRSCSGASVEHTNPIDVEALAVAVAPLGFKSVELVDPKFSRC